MSSPSSTPSMNLPPPALLRSAINHLDQMKYTVNRGIAACQSWLIEGDISMISRELPQLRASVTSEVANITSNLERVIRDMQKQVSRDRQATEALVAKLKESENTVRLLQDELFLKSVEVNAQTDKQVQSEAAETDTKMESDIEDDVLAREVEAQENSSTQMNSDTVRNINFPEEFDSQTTTISETQ